MRRPLRTVCAVLITAAAAPPSPAASIVSPAGDSVPANLLRIEIRLDAPRHEPLDLHQLRLRRAGQVIDDAFLGLPLPGRDGRSVTILLHPGRIKTGVGPNLAIGPALHDGDRVTLELDDPPLRQTWRVSAPLNRRIAVPAWRIVPPAAGSRTPLRITSDVELGAGAAGLIGVADEAGRRIAGQGRMGADGTQWHFIPTAPWRAARYTLRVHPALEDLAGNRPCAAFEQAALSAADCQRETTRAFVVERR